MNLITGDCITEMANMEPDSVDAIVTDPPYGLEFMGKKWDRYESEYYQQWTTEWATQALRVLKPGGSMLCFGGTRTFHRLTCGIEDAGFIIKDCLTWLYGQGFPKAQDLGKMIDKRAGMRVPSGELISENKAMSAGNYTRPHLDYELQTDLDRHWDGYKIGGIKPAWEPIIWAVKPPDGTYIDNVLKYGTGAVNVDECRIGFTSQDDFEESISGSNRWNKFNRQRTTAKWFGDPDKAKNEMTSKGRFPANLVLSHTPECRQVGEAWECSEDCPVRLLDEWSGISKAGTSVRHNIGKSDKATVRHIPMEKNKSFTDDVSYGDTGGASRFFYTSKATDRAPYNDHPTLKPTDLIEWLIRLVTRPGQTVLDPFAGSGTTGVAAVHTGREYILVEQDEHYCEIAEKRLDMVQMGMF